MANHSLSSKNQCVNPVFTQPYQNQIIKVFAEGDWHRFEYDNISTLQPKSVSIEFGLILARSVIDSRIFSV